jgi:hypothetical protein
MFWNKLSRYAEHDLQSLESHPASKNVFWRDVICAEVGVLPGCQLPVRAVPASSSHLSGPKACPANVAQPHPKLRPHPISATAIAPLVTLYLFSRSPYTSPPSRDLPHIPAQWRPLAIPSSTSSRTRSTSSRSALQSSRAGYRAMEAARRRRRRASG